MTSPSRPGGRTARTREAVVRAAGDLLAEAGLAGVDLAEVARRAGVGRTTVYRRWGSVQALVADVVAEMIETSRPRADTGTIEGDLLENANLVAETLADPRQGALFAAFVGAAAADDHVASLLRSFYDARLAEWAPCVTDAVARGELPEGTDPVAVVAAVSAPLYYRRLTRGEAPERKDAELAAHAALAAARAGLFSA
ncbi:TetR/AcrR family transcriptional regulator [Aeromicrobium alkaliterrae]|uniref:TetR-like C-terminal domain-containing protein n=1 Tax=Aeromicrobium alkaliterrae TaxID=302168 RepID=A0ABP4W2Z8_9ACTN